MSTHDHQSKLGRFFSRPLRWTLPLGILLAFIALQWLVPIWADLPEGWLIDARFLVRGPEQPRYPIVIVALDEDSFQMLGSDLQGENIRTWPRARWAELVNKIAAGKPRLIGLDVVFDTPGWDAGGDDALATALTNTGNVVLAANIKDARGVSSTGTVYQKDIYIPPIEKLGQAATAVGVANLVTDADDVTRRTPLYWITADKKYPPFPLVVATLYTGTLINVNIAELGTDLSLPIHFRGPEGTFRTLSMYDDVWNAKEPSKFLKDAIVLVGYTRQLEQDRHAAPFARYLRLPGVEVNANAIDTLLAGDWLHRPPAWAPWLLMLLAGLFALAVLNLPRPRLGVLALTGGVAAYLALGQGLFNWADYLLPLAAPTTVALAVGGTALAERMIFAEQDKRRLRQRFAGMMSPERLQAVLDNWEALLNPERPEKEAAVMFADIRGFTHATEALMRQNRSPEMVRFLNAYFDRMAQAVFLEGGVVYRTFGDGLLILFGVPEPLPHYALRAARAAVRMAQAAGELQALWPLRDEETLHMGIGIHCGPLIDAVVGRGRRFDYTVLGDPVNAASRIEGYCKAVMELPRPPGGQVPENVTILLSAELHEKVRGQVLVDESLPPFEARGKTAPLRVVRLLGLQDEIV